MSSSLKAILKKAFQAPSVDGYNSPGMFRNENSRPGSVTSDMVARTQTPQYGSKAISGVPSAARSDTPASGSSGVGNGTEAKMASALLYRILRKNTQG